MAPLPTRRTFLHLATSAALMGALALVGCGSQPTDNAQAQAQTDQQISVYSREDGSGTRSAFVELFGLEEKGADGSKVDTTTSAATITNSTSVMMTSIAGDPAGIGYVSLGSLNDSVKALTIDDVEPTPENVQNGSYKISRPFNIVVPHGASAAAQDFKNFIMSAEGQAVVAENHYIPTASSAPSYEARQIEGKVVVAGSSSVTPVMEKLAEAYKAVNPQVTVEVQQSDSTTGITMATQGTCDVGMSSRDLKDSELSSCLEVVGIAQDGIAVIVTPGFFADGLSSSQVKDIFNGTVTTWSEAVK